MPVRVASLDVASSSVTLTVGSEVTVFELTDTAPFTVEAWLDFSQLETGDSVTICEYVSLDGVTYRKHACVSIDGPLDEPIVRLHTKMLPANAKYRVGVTQTAGTARTVNHVYLKQVLEVV